MVLFVDLEDENADPPRVNTTHWEHSIMSRLKTKNNAVLDEGRINPNKNATTEALGCYPYAHSTATSATAGASY